MSRVLCPNSKGGRCYPSCMVCGGETWISESLAENIERNEESDIQYDLDDYDDDDIE